MSIVLILKEIVYCFYEHPYGFDELNRGKGHPQLPLIKFGLHSITIFVRNANVRSFLIIPKNRHNLNVPAKRNESDRVVEITLILAVD